MSERLKLLLTGGHAGATAYAVIQEIKSQKKPWDLYWIGPQSLIEGKKIDALERKTFPKIGVKVYSLFSGRLQRKFTFWTLISLLKIPLGFVQAIFLVRKISPNIVLSFGGFTSFPVVVASYILRIPIVSHDQTAAAGRANIYASFFSTKVAISREESRKYFPADKIIYTGNPVEPEILKIKAKKIFGDPPLILVTGGHSGSETINNVVEKILVDLLNNFKVIHQTGELQYKHFENLRNSLNAQLKARYFVYSTIEHRNWPKILSDCDIVVSRAGANVVSQIMVVKRPSILIPIPFAYEDEQTKNANIANKFGIARIIEQRRLNETVLKDEIYFVRDNWRNMVQNADKNESLDVIATKNIIELLEKVKKCHD